MFLLIIPFAIITSGSMPKAIWPWVMFSLTSFCGTLGYAGLSAHFPLNYAGRVSTAVNLITFLLALYTFSRFFNSFCPLEYRRLNTACFGIFGLFRFGIICNILYLI